MSSRDDDRRPRRLYAEGEDPDPRFSLANERTALAWMRTALAIVAGGVALLSLTSLPDVPRWPAVIGVVACLAGAAVACTALVGWRRAERALRLGRSLPAPVALLPLAAAIALLAAAAIVLGLVELTRGG